MTAVYLCLPFFSLHLLQNTLQGFVLYILINVFCPSGEITSKNVTVTGSLNEFFYQQCTWVLDSNVERQLFIDISSEQVLHII